MGKRCRNAERSNVAASSNIFISVEISLLSRTSSAETALDLLENLRCLRLRLTVHCSRNRAEHLSTENVRSSNGRCRLSQNTRFKSDNAQPTFGRGWGEAGKWYMQYAPRISNSRDGNRVPLRLRIITSSVISERDRNFCLIPERMAASWSD